ELEGGDLGGARDVPGVPDDPQRVRGALEGAERHRVRLAGQTALVSGASRGIGRAVALVFAREGARVALLARGRAGVDRGAGTIEAAGGTALVVPGDAAEEDAATHAVEVTLARFGRLDCLVTAQGAGTFGPLETSRLADWDAMLRANLTATYLMCRAALPPMLATGRGTIIAIATLAAERATAGAAAYPGTKEAVPRPGQSISCDGKGDGIG